MTEVEREMQESVSTERLLRIDPRGNNKRFELWETEAGPQWRRLREDGSPRRCKPENDRKLPLAQRLPQLKSGADVQVLAYRPGKRVVLQLTDERGERILKGYRELRLAAAVQRHVWAAKALVQAPVAAVDVVDVWEQASALEFTVAPGGSLDVSGKNGSSFRHIGMSLRQLQEARPFDNAPRHDAHHELDVLDGLAGAMGRAGIPRPADFDTLRAALPLTTGLLTAPLSPAHRDLHDGQFVADGQTLTLLDFDLACLADNALDAANLMAHLRLRELQGLSGADQTSFERCGQALLNGLGRSDQADFSGRLRFYQATTFLRLSLIYGLRPPWAHLSPELIDMARRCLHES